MSTCNAKNITGSKDTVVQASQVGKEDTPLDAERRSLYRSAIRKLQFTTNQHPDLGFRDQGPRAGACVVNGRG
eukprot:6647878-Heterocapsa_arctica.AAC.1